MHHKRAHRIRLIAPPERREDRRVLLPRLRVAATMVQRREDRLFELRAHLLVNADEIAVPRRRNQQRVELRVQLHELVVHMVARDVRAALLLHNTQPRERFLDSGASFVSQRML